MIAYDMAPANSVILLLQNQIFTDAELDFSQYKNIIGENDVYKELRKTFNFNPKEEIDTFLHEEILQVLKNMKIDEEEGQVLQSLIKYDSGLAEKYRNQRISRLLELGSALDDPLAQLMLGDLYQQGTIIPQNFTKAYEHYTDIIENRSGQSSADILGQAFYYMAEMNHYGTGRDKNLTMAIDFYNKSMSIGRGTVLSWIGMKLAQLERSYRLGFGYSDIDALDEKVPVSSLITMAFKKFEEQYAGKIVLVLLSLMLSLLFLVRLRLKNYIEIYLKDN